MGGFNSEYLHFFYALKRNTIPMRVVGGEGYLYLPSRQACKAFGGQTWAGNTFSANLCTFILIIFNFLFIFSKDTSF